MPRYLQYLFGVLIAGLLIAGPVAYYGAQQATLRNFREVKEGVLYRSGQMSLFGLQRVVHDYGIRTVITLRDATYPGDPPPDLEEEEFCLAQDINYCRISPRKWETLPDGSVPAEEGVRKFREIMDDPRNYPVLIHCFAGIHRSGAFSAIYRMEYEHWTNEEAIADLKATGYTTLNCDLDLLGYLEQYRPTWKQSAEPPAALPPHSRPAPRKRGAKKDPARQGRGS